MRKLSRGLRYDAMKELGKVLFGADLMLEIHAFGRGLLVLSLLRSILG